MRGALLAEYRLPEVQAEDWEDIAVGPCGLRSCVYVGDIGDNDAVRSEYVVYRIPEPAPKGTASAPVTASVSIERLAFRYPDGSHNAETLLVRPFTGDVLVVTKVPSGPAGVYRFPRPLRPDKTVTLEKVADLDAPECGPLLTGGDIHPLGDRVLLRGRGRACEVRSAIWWFPSKLFAGLLAAVPLALELQGESIAYVASGLGYVTTSEGLSAPLSLVTCGVATVPVGGEPEDGGVPKVSCFDTPEGCPVVKINEVDSNPNPDFIELFNPGPADVDLSGFFFTDADVDDPTHRFTFPAGTVLPAGGFLRLVGDVDFLFGLGDGDLVRLHEPGGGVIDELSWTAHAAGVLARCPDGGDSVLDVATPTPGASNAAACP